MAKRRMFSLDIVDTDRFLDMPTSAQNLYYSLGMRADDDGFVSSPKRIAAVCGSCIDDLKLLIAKDYIIPFDSGVIVITDWKVNDQLKSDRYKPTQYTTEKAQLQTDPAGRYISGTKTEPVWNQDGTNMEPQYRLGKDSIGKVSIGKVRESKESKERKADNAAFPPSPSDCDKSKPKRKRQGQQQETIADVFRAFAAGDAELEKALTDFDVLRATNKKPLTPRAAELICKKVTSLAKEAGVRNTHGYMIAILEQSIERGWDGVWAYKGDFKDAPTVHGSNGKDKPREIGPDDDITKYL